MKGSHTRPLLITGATGTLGRAFARICEVRGLSYRLLLRREMDIADDASVQRALTEHEPWAVVNAAGYVRVDEAESDEERCRRENTTGPKTLAAACARHGVKLVTFSSDLIFDGYAVGPYVESSNPSPLNVYGRSKAEAEREVLSILSTALVIRTSAFFGPWDKYNFATAALDTIAAGRRFRAADDATVSPTYVPDLVHASLDLLIDGEQGIWHLANVGATTWADLARRVACIAGFDESLIDGCRTQSFNLAALRPIYSALTSERGLLLAPLDDALSRFMREREVQWTGDTRREHAEVAHRAVTSS
jgi:dTDP-4-dehydrorhamnose reductase